MPLNFCFLFLAMQLLIHVLKTCHLNILEQTQYGHTEPKRTLPLNKAIFFSFFFFFILHWKNVWTLRYKYPAFEKA